MGNAVTSVRWMVAQLLSPVLRRTTLLLLFIWFANAISYYGLVLLATTVRLIHRLPALCHFIIFESCCTRGAIRSWGNP